MTDGDIAAVMEQNVAPSIRNKANHVEDLEVLRGAQGAIVSL